MCYFVWFIIQLHSSGKRKQTFIEAIFVHGPVNVEVLSSHQGELCLRVFVGAIIRVVTEATRNGCQ